MILLLAILLAVGLGVPAVQAGAMQMPGMEIAVGDGDGMSMPAKCPACDMTGQSGGVMGCVMPVCTSQPGLSSDGGALPLDSLRPLHLQPASLRLLTGHNSVPDPYPPRTSDIA